MKKIKNYIGGQLVNPVNYKYIKNIEPATGKIYGLLPNSGAADLQKAVDSAKRAKQSWANMPIENRAKLLCDLADIIDKNAEYLARAEATDNGKPITVAQSVDIYRASANIRFFAHACTQFSSESHAMEDNAINYTLRDPIGIVGCISPWNLPLYLLTWKIAPALATGNVVIAKPSEITPMTAFLFSHLCMKAKIPAGVINIIHGTGADLGAKIVTHPQIKAISFTGGTTTGAHIAAATAGSFKKLSLELGGKNPTLVFADCDFNETINTVVKAAFSNQGQICLCGSRIYIHESIYDKFKQAFIKKVETIIIGDPLDKNTQHGATVSKEHLDKILSYIELAKKEGGKILTGGKQTHLSGRCKDGFFVEPTVIENLDHLCRINQEEIFGPVCTLTPFSSDDEALMLANSTQYGLAASIWTRDLKRAHRLAKKIEAGIVWINCWLLRDLRTPFGGIKNSGVGSEGGLEAMRFFTQPKNVCIKY